MKAKSVLIEGICFLLAINFFYEGVYKLAHLDSYAYWIGCVPYLKPFKVPISYIVPLGEITLSLLLLFWKKRITSLYVSICAFVVFMLYFTLIFQFRNLLLFPYHALWTKPSWIQVMLMTLFLTWLAFMAIIYYDRKHSKKRILIK